MGVKVIKVPQETKQKVESLKVALERITGKKWTYSEVVELLLGSLYDLAECLEKKVEVEEGVRKALEVVKGRFELLKLPFSVETVKLLYPVRPEVALELKKLQDEYSVPFLYLLSLAASLGAELLKVEKKLTEGKNLDSTERKELRAFLLKSAEQGGRRWIRRKK